MKATSENKALDSLPVYPTIEPGMFQFLKDAINANLSSMITYTNQEMQNETGQSLLNETVSNTIDALTLLQTIKDIQEGNSLPPVNDDDPTDDVFVYDDVERNDDDDVLGDKSTSHKPETSKNPAIPDRPVSRYAMLIRTAGGMEIPDYSRGISVPDAIERARLLPGDVVLSCVRM